MKISEDLIQSAYQIARRYYDANGEIRITDAKKELASLGINPNSSGDMIYNLKHLLDGERYARNLSAAATRYYMFRIQQDYGTQRLRNAVSALKQHIEYYQALTGAPMISHVTILSEYENLVGAEEETILFPEEFPNGTPLREGRLKSVLVNIYERNPRARLRCIDHYGPSCSVCGFDFEAKYGAIGKGFVHVHHLVDLASIRDEYEIDPIQDLRPVCPNCHAMLHKSVPAYSIAELQKFINRQKK